MKKLRIVTLIIIILFTMGLLIVSGQGLKPKVIVWGSASLGSRGYVCMEAFASTLNKLTDLKNSSISTAGGAENLALIDQGEIHLGQGMRLDLYNAYHGMPPYDHKLDFVQVLSYGTSGMTIAVMPDSGIETIKDLAGKRLCVGPANGGAVPLMKAVLKEYGILEDVKLAYMGWSEAPDALGAGQIDASGVWISGGFIPHSGFQKLAIIRDFRLLDMDRDKLENIAKDNEGFSVGTVQKKAFSFLTGDKLMAGSSNILVADPNLDEEIVYEIVKTLYENEEDVRSIDPQSLSGFYMENALDNIIPNYPIHPGAVRYFKEIGIWSDDLIVYKYK